MLDIGGPPPDKYKVAWLICLLLGVGALFPWNAFITAGDYFTALFKDVKFPFITVLPLFFNYPNILFMILNIIFGKYINPRWRIIIAFLLEICVFTAIPIMDYSNFVRRNPDSSMWIVLGFAGVCGLSAGVLMGTILGVTALLPHNYTTAVMSGNGIAGIIIGGLRILTKAAVERSPAGTPEFLHEQQLSATIYFAVSAFIILCCIIGTIILHRLPFYQYFVMKQKEDDGAPLLSGSEKHIQSLYDYKTVSKRRVLKKIWVEALEAFYTFFVTLSLFPGTIFLMKSTSSDKEFFEKGWFFIVLTVLFQVFDYIGRTLPSAGLFPSRKWLWIPTLARTVFFPLFVLCIDTKAEWSVGRVFNSDWFPYCFMALFALSNGYWGTLAMIYGPTRVDDHEKETAGSIMSFFLQGGIISGLHFAFFFNWYANPDTFKDIFSG